MQSFELHIPETAGWRALLTRAELSTGVCLGHQFENYLIHLLLGYVGQPVTSIRELANSFMARLLAESPVDSSAETQEDLVRIGNQCLVFAGLFPEHAANQHIPTSYLVQVGRSAYRQAARKQGQDLYGLLAEHFVSLMDVLQALRDLENGEFCLDALTAYDQWRETGSAHAWRVLTAMTVGLPAAADPVVRVH